jgi:hypothetical protein
VIALAAHCVDQSAGTEVCTVGEICSGAEVCAGVCSGAEVCTGYCLSGHCVVTAYCEGYSLAARLNQGIWPENCCCWCGMGDP